jgi:predicted neutral ceramidase superfamily lipid hydrolase
VFRDNTWQCDNCFSVFAAAPAAIDDVELEAGLTMAEVMRMYEERAARE